MSAQAPALIPYQAVARNGSGQALSNATINARFTIHDGTATGVAVWQEMQTVTTSALGLFTASLGTSVPLTGVNWGSGDKFMQVEIDLGQGFLDLGTQQMLSVPYALYGNAAGNGIAGVSTTGDTLFMANGNYLIVPGISAANDNSGGGGTTTGTTEHTCGAANVHNPNLTYGSMTDQEGNVYKTIVIGTQEWMAENLNTSIYRNGDAISTNLNPSDWWTDTTGAWTYYNNDANYACPFGKLYNWYTGVDSRQLCPTGWHVPSEMEWQTLVNFLDPAAEPWSNVAGAKMKSIGTLQAADGFWNSPNTEATNSSGFSAIPGGSSSAYSLNSQNLSDSCGFWSTTYDQFGFGFPTLLELSNGNSYASIEDYFPPWRFYSVRCLRDTCLSCELVVGCTDFSACNFNSAATQNDGSCVFPGNSCNDNNSLTIGDVWTADCVCEGTTFSTGTTEHTCGAANVHNPNLTYGSMTDQEGNVYKTIVIGTQEWMAENLNTSVYRNGDAIPTNLDNTAWQNTTSGAWAYYNNDPSYACPYGKMYNWYTCVDNRQLCPVGWHVPSYAEWTILESYLGGQSVAGGKMKSTGTIESLTGLWNAPNTGATNSSGFSALPGGYLIWNGSQNNIGGSGYWWSSTEVGSDYAWWSTMDSGDDNLGSDFFNKNDGHSIRCLRD